MRKLSSLSRALKLLRVLAEGDAGGMRVVDLSRAVDCNQPTAHRALQELAEAGFVEQVPGGKRYRLGLDFYVVAASAGRADGLRDIARPALLRLSSTLSDTVFLFVRNAYDAVCIDRVDGRFAIASFTGDIGGKVPLGLGQGALAILAHLPENEREAVIRHNMPRMLDRGFTDEAAIRMLIAEALEKGFAAHNAGLISGMAGIAVPVFDARGYAVAALSVGTLSDRLRPDRLPTVAAMLKQEAAEVSSRVNPFDQVLRKPFLSLSSG